jgi:hypothetical protein
MIKRIRAYSQRVAVADAARATGATQQPWQQQDYSRDNPKDLLFEGAMRNPEDANLVTSHVKDDPGVHAVCIDIDMPCQLFESRTPGHHHLYIDKKIEWEAYVKLLRALAEAGIVEQGYVDASVAKGCTALRIPQVEQEFARLKADIPNLIGES